MTDAPPRDAWLLHPVNGNMATILDALIAGDRTIGELVSALYGSRLGPPNTAAGVVKVTICHLRKRLNPEWEIAKAWGKKETYRLRRRDEAPLAARVEIAR